MQLNEVLRATNFELEQAKVKAEESDRLKTAFLQNISHEVRTPLNGIIGFTSLLNSNDITEEEIAEYTSFIKESGDRLIETISNIIDISKIETRQIDNNFKMLHINGLMEDLFSLFISRANQKVTWNIKRGIC